MAKRVSVPAGAEDEPRETATQDEVPVGANVEEASVPEVQEARREPVEWVVYKDAQQFEERVLSTNDWARVGVTDAPTVRWDASNKHRVRKSDLDFLDEEQFRRFILDDPRFEVVAE